MEANTLQFLDQEALQRAIDQIKDAGFHVAIKVEVPGEGLRVACSVGDVVRYAGRLEHFYADYYEMPLEAFRIWEASGGRIECNGTTAVGRDVRTQPSFGIPEIGIVST